MVTAGFWSKDEILADAFAHGHMAIFITLAVAAFCTAFYTMRQITLTFLGEGRTKAAQNASETPWTMTLPLVVLSVFAIGFGWLGIPEHFPGIGGYLPNWFHEFVGSTLAEAPESAPFNWIPLVVSLFVALGGLLLGWLVYRKVKSPSQDFLQIPVLRTNGILMKLTISYLSDLPSGSARNSPIFSWIKKSSMVLCTAWHASPCSWAILFGITLTNQSSMNSSGTAQATWSKPRVAVSRKIQAGRIQYYMAVSMTLLVLLCPAILLPVGIGKDIMMEFILDHILTFILFLPVLGSVVDAVPAQGENESNPLDCFWCQPDSLYPDRGSVDSVQPQVWKGINLKNNTTGIQPSHSSFHVGVDGLSLTHGPADHAC